MRETTKEEKKEIEQKLKKIKLNLKDIPAIFKVKNSLPYKAKSDYENGYKIYQFIDVGDIDIYITKSTRLDDTIKKYKNAKPIIEYLSNDDENITDYNQFLNMVEKLNLNIMDSIEEEQKKFKSNIPYEVKYNDNFYWDIYYSELDDKYFMLFPIEEERVECLFYLIKKKIETMNSKKKSEKIYVPINNKDMSFNYLKKSEISDIENYLWFFTGNWPNIYEVFDIDGNKTIQITGDIKVYENIETTYKFTLNNKTEAQEQFKLIKALFILQSNMEEEYCFKLALQDDGRIGFYYNFTKITYSNLSEFIKTEVNRKKEKINNQIANNIIEKERWILLRENVEKKKTEFMIKEKQIVTFLECKKSFFGRISYFFKKRKNNIIPEESNLKEEKNEEITKFEIEEKENYTIEDLLKIGEYLLEKEKEYKNIRMDIKALNNKKESLERKIKNATSYINEIESHKKSIFDFWKFTNKDENNLLESGTQENKEEEHLTIKRKFSFENDIEELSKKADDKQRQIFNEKETDAIFAVYQDLNSFNLISKNKLLKKDEKEIEKQLKQFKEQYKNEYEQIKEKDFDIFGGVVEDKTKIKILKKNKHREIEKDKYKVLNINLKTDLENYKEVILNYKKILDEIKNTIKIQYDIPIYKISNKTIENDKLCIMDMNPINEINKVNIDDDEIILNKLNLKEGMQTIFYSNIMFYNNRNRTLPLGMDISTEVLIDLEKYKINLVSRNDFKLNIISNEVENKIKTIHVYEYNIE